MPTTFRRATKSEIPWRLLRRALVQPWSGGDVITVTLSAAGIGGVFDPRLHFSLHGRCGSAMLFRNDTSNARNGPNWAVGAGVPHFQKSGIQSVALLPTRATRQKIRQRASEPPATPTSKMMLPVLTILALGLGQASAQMCAGEVFFGEDRNPDDTQNNVLPLPATPNADEARDMFFLGIDNPSTEDLESLAVGDTSASLVFPGSGVTATLQGGEVRADPPVNGQYAISPENYFSTDDDFSITFSESITAFGFFGVDIGDVQGVLTFTAIRTDGTTCTLNIPHEVDGPSGGVLYFAYIDLAESFIGVSFTNSEGNRDRYVEETRNAGNNSTCGVPARIRSSPGCFAST
eukprot:scaffold482_cov247-Pinguiococcus_pyrenoidosus.AAC.25